MTDRRIRMAGGGDLDVLVELMREFYAETGMPLDPGVARRAFATLVGDPRLGRVWILQDGDGRGTAGYVVLTLGYSMEFGGYDAFVDDLFVRPPYRSRGLGRAALDTVIGECRSRDVRAVHLEVDRNNGVAKRLYGAFGFVDHDRELLTRTLTDGGDPGTGRRPGEA
jgi:GNAT superfamily N-acetyltransferase